MSIEHTKCIKPIPRPKTLGSGVEYYSKPCPVQILTSKRIAKKSSPKTKKKKKSSTETVNRNGIRLDSERSRVLTREEERDLLRKIANGNEAARNDLIEHNLRLVAYVAKSYAKNKDIFDELFSEGCTVLFHAINRFDLSYETKFSTYATWWLRQSMSKYLQTKNGNGIATEYDLLSEEDDCNVEMTERQKMIRGCLCLLTEREQEIIRRRFGIGCEPETLDQIGIDHGLSKERIRQIESKAMDKIRPILTDLE